MEVKLYVHVHVHVHTVAVVIIKPCYAHCVGRVA